MVRSRSILFAFLIFSAFCGWAQQYNIKSYTTKNGLANSIVNDVFLDSRGYIWFATQGGVSRFDGKIFVNYSSKQGLPGNDITNIAEDAQGNIWIATYGYGVSKFDGLKFTNYTKKDGLGDDKVYGICLDSKKNLWFATFGGGVTRYDGKAFKSFTTDDGLPGNEFFSVAEDKYGMLWFGSRQKGLVKYNGHTFQTFTTSDGLTHNSVYSLYFDHKGALWIGTTAGGACKMENDVISAVNIPGYEKDVVFSIVEDKHDNIWLATEHGLIKYDGRGYKFFTEQQGIVASYINSVCEDYEGNLWIATGSGVSMFKNEAFVTYTEKEGMTTSKVTTECEDDHGNIIIGTNGSKLNILTGDKISAIPIPELDQSITYSILKDSQGKIWLGTESSDDGIIVLEYANGTYRISKKIKNLNGKEIKTVSRIIEDKDKNIWVGTYGLGLFKITGEKSENFTDSTSLPTNNIFTLAADSKGNIWIGTNQGGVTKYDGTTKSFRTFTKQDGLGDNSVWSICEDSKGNMFFGTNENGITCYDGKTFKSITTADGLASDLIYALITDNKDRLWVGTEKGIDKISFGKDFSIAGMKYYGDGDGLKGIEVGQHGFIFDKEKTLWIATSNGLTRYNASYDYVNSTPPRLIMSSVKLYFQNVDWSKYTDKIDTISKLPTDLTLSYKDNHLTFDFRALTTGNVNYQYKLDGQDDEWSPPSQNTEAVYTNIRPGSYTFRVKAINSDGFESKDDLVFTFTITPPFWQTWWFYTICIIVAGGAVAGFINYRTAQLAKEKKVLEEKVEERTGELKKANDQLSVAYTEIKDSINYAKRIQQSILPLEHDIKKAIPENFILFRPRDVVSGDFYWFYQKDDLIYIAACDCTGHGVPGAFMSIIGSSLLNEVMNETDLKEPAKIMDHLREKLIYVLKQQTSEIESKDGMDMVLVCIDKANSKITFAGANNPLYFISNGELQEFKGNKQPVGVYGDVLKPFTNQEQVVKKGDMIYIFTDGFPDQFGGELGKKFLYKRFKEVLVSIHQRTMNEQVNDLEKAFLDWKAGHYQVDDVLVIGIRIS